MRLEALIANQGWLADGDLISRVLQRCVGKRMCDQLKQIASSDGPPYHVTLYRWPIWKGREDGSARWRFRSGSSRRSTSGRPQRRSDVYKSAGKCIDGSPRPTLTSSSVRGSTTLNSAESIRRITLKATVLTHDNLQASAMETATFSRTPLILVFETPDRSPPGTPVIETTASTFFISWQSCAFWIALL